MDLFCADLCLCPPQIWADADRLLPKFILFIPHLGKNSAVFQIVYVSLYPQGLKEGWLCSMPLPRASPKQNYKTYAHEKYYEPVFS